jgi:hypothetical protein
LVEREESREVTPGSVSESSVVVAIVVVIVIVEEEEVVSVIPPVVVVVVVGFAEEEQEQDDEQVQRVEREEEEAQQEEEITPSSEIWGSDRVVAVVREVEAEGEVETKVGEVGVGESEGEMILGVAGGEEDKGDNEIEEGGEDGEGVGAKEEKGEFDRGVLPEVGEAEVEEEAEEDLNFGRI